MSITTELHRIALELLAALKSSDPEGGWHDATSPDHYCSTLANRDGTAIVLRAEDYTHRGGEEQLIRVKAEWCLPPALVQFKHYSWAAPKTTIAAERGGAALLKPLLRQAPDYIKELDYCRSLANSKLAIQTRERNTLDGFVASVATARKVENIRGEDQVEVGITNRGATGIATVRSTNGQDVKVKLVLDDLSPAQATAVMQLLFGE
jgi:hypothetical protein